MKKHISRILAMVMAIAMVFCLTACGHEHQWADANCLSPKTCTSCEETEGEALGHTWVEANCTDPKTCSVCGAAEGQALGHTWVEANYQQPKTCAVCNATEGDPLITYFEESGLDARLLDMSGAYELPITCYHDESKTTIAKVTVEDYKTIASDETHEAMDGYEWKVMTFKLHIHDENAQRYGFQGFHYLWVNRYDNAINDGDSDNEGLFTTGVQQTYMWNGTEYKDGVLRIEESGSDWQKDENDAYYFDIFVTVSVRVPVGYDELVFGLEHTGWDWPEGRYLHESITDSALLFRFN